MRTIARPIAANDAASPLVVAPIAQPDPEFAASGSSPTVPSGLSLPDDSALPAVSDSPCFRLDDAWRDVDSPFDAREECSPELSLDASWELVSPELVPAEPASPDAVDPEVEELELASR